MKKLLLFSFLILQTSSILSEEYLYPIANIDDETILMMHQKSLDDLELLSFDSKNNCTQKLLSSLYLPAYVQIIPGKNRYSFIDRGRIYIKDFSKRTPRALDIYQPICDIQSLQWMSDHECIFSAKYKNNYKLFLYDMHKDGGTLYKLCHLDDGINYIFPSAVHKNIFCLIQNDSSNLYDLAQIPWAPTVFEEPVDEKDSAPCLVPLLKRHETSLCFLTMKSLSFGYVLEIVEHEPTKKMFTFGCSKIEIESLSLSRLFEFQIPEDFIIGMDKNRFFESLYPLLPYYKDQEIYFTSYNDELQRLNLYLYNLETQIITDYQTLNKNIGLRHNFCPLIVENTVYVGHSIEG